MPVLFVGCESKRLFSAPVSSAAAVLHTYIHAETTCILNYSAKIDAGRLGIAARPKYMPTLQYHGVLCARGRHGWAELDIRPIQSRSCTKTRALYSSTAPYRYTTQHIYCTTHLLGGSARAGLDKPIVDHAADGHANLLLQRHEVDAEDLLGLLVGEPNRALHHVALEVAEDVPADYRERAQSLRKVKTGTQVWLAHMLAHTNVLPRDKQQWEVAGGDVAGVRPHQFVRY